ncbi:sulfate ABC transporter substrate-binding protein, partial [Candidatus Erwinia dacicola]|nr:sulfate ABC transporter substrate-binding protein [Candidatus Erwinia dacicola]
MSATALSILLATGVQATELLNLNSSYDVSRFTALNAPFEQQWAQQHPGDTLTIKQSHARSSKQALAILQGLKAKADVVTYNQTTDVQILHDKGNLIPADWKQRLPNNSSPFYSIMAFLVRKGNPKNIHDWNDLVIDDVK